MKAFNLFSGHLCNSGVEALVAAQRLPGKVTDEEINCCLEWVAAVSKQRG